MTQDDSPDFFLIMTMVAEHVGKTISNDLIHFYWSALIEYDLATVREAILNHLRNPDVGQWMPKIADIHRAIAGGTEDRALRAWSKVDRAVRRQGPYVSVVFDDPVIHATLHEMGGWIAFSQKKESEWPFVEKEFITRYRGNVRAASALSYPAMLIGIADADRQRRGLSVSTPVLLGNAQQAQSVFLLGTSAVQTEVNLLPVALLQQKRPPGGLPPSTAEAPSFVTQVTKHGPLVAEATRILDLSHENGGANPPDSIEPNP